MAIKNLIKVFFLFSIRSKKQNTAQKLFLSYILCDFL